MFFETILLAVGTLLPIMNPFSTAPLFVSLTANFDEQRRNRQALLGCVYAFLIIATFLLVGSWIIDFFGISIPGIRAAGGLVISTIGFRMLFPAPPAVVAAADAPKQDEDIAFTPIAMPSLAGPGSISVVLTAASNVRSIRPDDWPLMYVAIIIGMIAVLVFSWLVLRTAASMVRFMGKAGLDAMTRIFGFLLVCIGSQFVLTGIADFFGLARMG
jgi:multiple antibiotic resistance protein